MFWETNEKQGEWYTFCPHELKGFGVDLNNCYGEVFNERYKYAVQLHKEGKLKLSNALNSRDLAKKFMRTQVETGLPYVTFIDALNEGNPNKHEGIIPCFNLCTESASVLDPYNYSHVCNLASVVLGRMSDYEEIAKYSGLITEVLDSGIELTSPPTDCSSKHNNTFRTIGVG